MFLTTAIFCVINREQWLVALDERPCQPSSWYWNSVDWADHNGFTQPFGAPPACHLSPKCPPRCRNNQLWRPHCAYTPAVRLKARPNSSGHGFKKNIDFYVLRPVFFLGSSLEFVLCVALGNRLFGNAVGLECTNKETSIFKKQERFFYSSK